MTVATCEHDFQWHPASDDFGVCSLCGAEAPEEEMCGRLLVGQGGDTYDPLCVLPRGHSGRCLPDPELEQNRGSQ